MNKPLLLILLTVIACILMPEAARSAFNENVAVSTKSISLANACTANPPGLMSPHFNPAGLSLLKDGKWFSNGLTLADIKRTGNFTADPEWEGILNNTWGPNAEANPDDPNSYHGGPDPLAGKSGTNDASIMYVPIYDETIPIMAAPTLGVSYRKPGSKWTLAYANYAPVGGGVTHYDEGDPLSFGTKKMYWQHMVYAAPTVSYQVTDTLSLGLSIGIGQTSFGLQMDMRAVNELASLTRVLGDATKDLEIPVLSEQTLPPPWFGGGLGPYDKVGDVDVKATDDVVPTYNIGALWKPKEWLSFGLCYQSEIHAEVNGTYTFRYSDQFQRVNAWNGRTPMTMQTAGMLDIPINGLAEQSGVITGNRVIPQQVHLGFMVKPFSRLSLMADLHWAQWSVNQQDRFVTDQRIQLLRLVKLMGYTGGDNALVIERNMKDTWSWSVGMEYMVTDNFALRCGYEFRPSSFQEELLDLTCFLVDTHNFGVGAWFKLHENTELELALGYVKSDPVIINNDQSTTFNSTKFTEPMGNFYSGLDYEGSSEIFIASFTMTLPLEEQMAMVEHILETINPFHKDEVPKTTEKKAPELTQKTNHKTETQEIPTGGNP